MRLLGDRTVYPQLDRRFELGLIAACVLVAVFLVALALLAAPAAAGCNCSRAESAGGNYSGRETGRWEGFRNGVKQLFRNIELSIGGKLTTRTPMVNQGYVDGSNSDWSIGIQTLSNGTQQRGYVSSAGSFVGPIDSAGRLLSGV